MNEFTILLTFLTIAGIVILIFVLRQDWKEKHFPKKV